MAFDPDEPEPDDDGRGGRRCAKRAGRFRIPVRYGYEALGVHARTPCEAAWAVPAHQTAVRRWMEEKLTEERYTIPVKFDGGETRDAVFVRGSRIVFGKLVTTVQDALTGSVFCGKEILDEAKARAAVPGAAVHGVRDPDGR
jgi:hypothetical protein